MRLSIAPARERTLGRTSERKPNKAPARERMARRTPGRKTIRAQAENKQTTSRKPNKPGQPINYFHKFSTNRLDSLEIFGLHSFP